MSLAAYIPLLGFVCNLLLAVFVLSRGMKATPNRVYFAALMIIAWWNFGSFQLFRVADHDPALFWARFLHFGLVFGPVVLFHLSLLIAQIPVGRYIRWMYGFEALFSLSVFTPYFIKDIRVLDSNGWYSMAGTLYPVFSTQFVLYCLSVIILIRKRRRLPTLQKTRLSSLILAQSLLVIFGTNDILPIIGFDHYPFFPNVVVYPYGSFAAILYGIMVAYSMLQYQLLDIHLALSRIAAHAVRFGFMFFIGLTLLLTVAVFEPAFTTGPLLSALGVLMVTGLIASIVFPRIFGSGAENLEKRILGDRFEYHDQIRNFIASMQFFTDTNVLLSDFHDLMLKIVCVRRYQIILLDETTRTFSLLRSHPEETVQTFPDLHSQSPVFRFFKETKAEYLACGLTYSSPAAASLEQEARAQLKQFGAEFCFPFLFDDDPFGLVLIGDKTSGDPFTSTDLSLFVLLVKNLSMMINQIRLKNQLLQNQEMELLGRMSRGMAHDLNNLLTPVSTLLQLMAEGASTEDVSEELLPVALRNIKTMRAYIRESLFFSENLRPDFQLGRLDMLISHAIEITHARREAKSINVVGDTPGEVLVEMDEVLVQRLIVNIVGNAIDASPPGSTVRIELVRLVKTEAFRDWLRIRIIDNGEGIKPEHLDRVLTPYFTTKDRGDTERGFGLGLAICRKIVHLHNGNLNITSQVKKGTTVQIDLPSRQMKLFAPEASLK